MRGIFQTVVAVLGTWLTYLFGGWSALMGVLLAFVVIDYITGFLAAGYEGKLSSAVGMRGIAKKIGIFVLVAIGHLVDTAIGDGSLIRDAAIYFYLANELLSITENVGVLGVPIPGVIQKAVEILRGKSEPTK